MGVELNDRSKKWTVLNISGHPYKPLGGRLTAAASESTKVEVDTLLAARHEAKRARDFRTADEAQESLRRLGVEVDDFSFTWKFNEANAMGPQ